LPYTTLFRSRRTAASSARSPNLVTTRSVSLATPLSQSNALRMAANWRRRLPSASTDTPVFCAASSRRSTSSLTSSTGCCACSAESENLSRAWPTRSITPTSCSNNMAPRSRSCVSNSYPNSAKTSRIGVLSATAASATVERLQVVLVRRHHLGVVVHVEHVVGVEHLVQRPAVFDFVERHREPLTRHDPPHHPVDVRRDGHRRRAPRRDQDGSSCDFLPAKKS